MTVAIAVFAFGAPTALADAAANRPTPKNAVLHPVALPGMPPLREYTVGHSSPGGLQKKALPLTRYATNAPTWPAAGATTVALTHLVSGTGSPGSGVSARSAAGSIPAGASGSASTAPRTVAVTGPVKAGSLPLWVAPAPQARTHAASGVASGAASMPTQVRLQVSSHAQAVAAGANGMLVGVSRADGAVGIGQVQLVVDYASLAQAYGGGYGSRLQMFLMPACALTAPQVQACRTRTPLSFDNRAAADQLVATVPVGAAGPRSRSRTAVTPLDTSGSMSLVAVTSGNAGSQGNFGATSLSPSGSWQASGSGAFTYSYAVNAPAAVGGGAPSVDLSYDSQAVDGETSGRNSQASWIGDGWSYQPGYVERSYRSCNSLLDSSGNRLLKGSGDECWGGDNATISFGSHSGVLVPMLIDTTNPNLIAQYALQGDDGTVVQELKGASNGLYQGVYYRVLTMDGSAAYFGAEHAPTGAGINGGMQTTASDASTNSAWGVPVLHPVSGDPCYDSTDGKASKCSAPEGWRWNLDFTVSPSGAVQRYDYTTESNYYDLGGGQAASGSSGTLTKYTRGGQLASISYGYTLADAQAGHTPAAQIVFAPAQRCQVSSTFDCTAAISPSNATNWPDVPYDLHCNSTDSTTLPAGSTSVPAGVCVTNAPSYWTTTRLASITTKVNVAGKGLTTLDSYSLGQLYTDAGATADPLTGTSIDPKDAGALQGVMWLQTIQHTGSDSSGNQLSMNPVVFQGTEVDNRVNDNSPMAPPLYRPRISSVNTETGGQIAVVYNLNPCAGLTLSFSSADSNVNSCYPVYWTPPGNAQPNQDWFNKITVYQVWTSDQTTGSSGSTNKYNPNHNAANQTGSEAHLSTYSYAGAAWHRDDSAQTDDQYRTWDQFRGFRTVTVRTGIAPEPVTRTTTTYLQGMNGDYLANGRQRSVSVSATLGGDSSKVLQTVQDDNWLAGTALETDTYTAAGGTIAAETVAGPLTYTQTGSQPQSPWTDWNTTDDTGSAPALSTLPPLLGERTASSTGTTYALLADGQTWRQKKTTTNYDGNGRVSTVDTQSVDAKFGATVTPAQETCSTTSYATAPSANPQMLSYADQVTTVNAAIVGTTCPAANAANLRTDKKSYYDGTATLAALPAFGQVVDNGRVTATSIATGFDTGGNEQWRALTAVSYDGAGRVVETDTPNPGDATDPTGTKNPVVTKNSYTPAWQSSGSNTDAVEMDSATGPQQWTTKTFFDPLNGLPVSSVDPNGRTTTMTYDALGRRTAVWLPGQDQTKGALASQTFSYSINPGAVYSATGNLTTEGAPSSVTTSTLRDDGATYSTSVAIYDGMLQARQTQATPAGENESGRLISDTFYDSHGWPAYSYAAQADPNNNAPSGTLYTSAEASVVAETSTFYDGQGRPTVNTLWHDAVEQWQSTTSYPGADETDHSQLQDANGQVIPGNGGASTQSFTNALGQTVKSVVQNTTSMVKIVGGQVIPSGTTLTSASVRLAMQADGNLVIYSVRSGLALWATGTASPGAYAVFGTDGNLVVYSASGTSLWTTGHAASSGATLALQNDGNLVINPVSGGPVAVSNTGGQAQADSTTAYTYWPNGQVATIADSAGNQWKYQYNLLGQKISQTDPNTGTSSYGPYDVAGNLQQGTDSRGQTTSTQYDWHSRVTGTFTGAWTSSPNPANQLTADTYDTLAVGYPTSEIRYVGGKTTGKAYTQSVTGYSTRYQPTGTTVDIPTGDGFPQPTTLPAGIAAAPSGYTRYATTAGYSSVDGLLKNVQFGNDGGLASENVQYSYNQANQLWGISGWIASNNTPSYLTDTIHDAYGRVQEADYNTAASGSQFNSYAQYDQTTGRVTQTSDWSQKANNDPDQVSYRYNQAGDITAVDDLQGNTTHDTQCFSYDAFNRLTTAWSDTKGLGAAGTGDTGGCVSATPTGAATPAAPKATTVGGPAAYWQDYTYDLLGDRTSMVNHDTTGNAANNTTQTVAYSGTNATSSTAEPNEATSVTSTNPGLGSTTTTPSYADPGYSGVNAGNTMKRTSSGPLVTGFTLSTGGKLCIDDASGSTTPENKVQVYSCNSSSSQQWTMASDGTVQLTGKNVCLDTAGDAIANGTKVVIDTCDHTRATQQWKPTPSGTLVNLGTPTSAPLCLADPAASATIGTQQVLWTCGSGGQTWTTPGTGQTLASPQTFTYDAEGRTSTVMDSVGSGAQTSSYLYDAAGNLLEQSTTGTNTKILYLFGGSEQITVNAPTGGATAIRYYSGPGGVTITRTNTGALNYQVSNAQGTAECNLDATTLTATHRYYDPYGNPRGAQPSTWVNPSMNRGYLGQPTDQSVGLNLLGARAYDPSIGRFTSPDPVFEAGDPNQMGGYTYAGDNPSTGSDPQGLWCDDCRPSGGGGGGSSTSGPDTCTCQCQGTCGPPPQTGPCTCQCQGTCGSSAPATATINKELNNWLQKYSPNTDDPKYALLLWFGYLAVPGQNVHGDYWTGATHGAQALCFGREACNQAFRYLQNTGDLQGAKVIAAFYCIWNDCIHHGQYSAQEYHKGQLVEQQLTSEFLLALGAADDFVSGDNCVSCQCSFAPDTLVLLADGKTKPIGKLKVGDKVESADPTTGKDKGARTVQHVWINHDTDLLDVAIDEGNGHTSVIHTTANHPFWDNTTHTWVHADQLQAGHKLASTHGARHPSVVGTTITPGAADRWNLTVQELHTYYVVVGGTPVLVHNACGTSGHAGDCYCNYEGMPEVLDPAAPGPSGPSVSGRDVHGALRDATRTSGDEIWNDPSSVMYIQSRDGQVVKVLPVGNGVYNVAVRDMSNSSGGYTTVIKDFTQKELDGRIASGAWGAP
ncbi:polymorphic toxin-type HINT domain-containing protein [Streptacidiphilus jiangxiensis]|uniref:Intein N-terminal splicing region/RHS repeat-associated core domain-containing protein n=1 Tax=Streptacidiphilus jiangxiensis TaxID=235985 RepID=A0A1H7VWM4_STRJI|nr:polymorphic toxin-type HINT domain-containing protein [Streptacidiphilus jiangxiensis]SEM13217.1 intein N-terminal splicing region/RHS repeat-associated core domain-containing protein [Streptacidiphilus jiangxiensis]